MGQLAAFAALSLLVLTAAFWVVSLSNLFRAALSLGLVLIGIAGLFLLLEAEFLAFAQILIYVGAILTLLVFAIMLTAKMQQEPAAPASRNRWGASAAALAVFGMLACTTQAVHWPTLALPNEVTLPILGQRLVTTWILPFEVISLVFVAVIAGAVAVAGAQRPQTSKTTQRTHAA